VTVTYSRDLIETHREAPKSGTYWARIGHETKNVELEAPIYKGSSRITNCLLISEFRVQVPGCTRENRFRAKIFLPLIDVG
jgi:hypothetical protein